MTRIKICGLKREEDIDYANMLKPDFVGFVFAKSKRQISLEQGKILREKLLKEIPTVGVFVNEKVDFITELVKENIISIVQLHGDEGDDYIEKLREKVGEVTIVKAIRMKEDTKPKDIKTKGNYILYDAYSSQAYGGTGETFNWKNLLKENRKYFLAGGIHKGNVLQAIEMLHPYAVDVSSAVETDGKKDFQKMKEFIEIIREYDKEN